jgi:hypothetical protein
MADYEALDLSEIQSEYQRVSQEPGTQQGDDYLQKYVRLPERDGYVMLRILPKKKGKNLFCATRVHTLTNPTTRKSRTLHCPRELTQTQRGPRWMGDCIICKYYSDMWQKSEDSSLSTKAKEELQTAARKLKPVERYYYNVIVRSEKDKEGNLQKNVGPKIYSCGKTVHAKIMRAIIGDESAGEPALGDVTNPKSGRDFKVVKKVVKGGGGAEYPNYDNSKFEDLSPVGSPTEFEKWINEMHDLQSLREVKSIDELKHALKVHLGMIKEGEDTGSDDLDEFRTGSSSKPSSSVNEDLVTSTPVTSSVSTDDDEILADDDFMKELDSM